MEANRSTEEEEKRKQYNQNQKKKAMSKSTRGKVRRKKNDEGKVETRKL